MGKKSTYGHKLQKLNLKNRTGKEGKHLLYSKVVERKAPTCGICCSKAFHEVQCICVL